MNLRLLFLALAIAFGFSSCTYTPPGGGYGGGPSRPLPGYGRPQGPPPSSYGGGYRPQPRPPMGRPPLMRPPMQHYGQQQRPMYGGVYNGGYRQQPQQYERPSYGQRNPTYRDWNQSTVAPPGYRAPAIQYDPNRRY